jgi:hypothetical protein
LILQILTFIVAWIPSIILGFWNLYMQRNLKRLEEKNEKQIHVHKLQFEKEFNIYLNLWANLVQIRNESFGLRTEFFATTEGENYKSAINEKIETVSKLCRELIYQTQSNQPFFSEEVFSEIMTFIKLVRKEAFLASRGPKNDNDYWEEGDKFYDKISIPIENIQIAIRKRIRNLNTDNS